MGLKYTEPEVYNDILSKISESKEEQETLEIKSLKINVRPLTKEDIKTRKLSEKLKGSIITEIFPVAKLNILLSSIFWNI